MRNRQAQTNATELRKRMTDAEQALWSRLRMRQVKGYKFRRQYPVGAYIADFACVEAGLIVELDGGQHGEQVQQDETRTRALNEAGFKVLRFWNDEIFKEMDGVLQRIFDELPLPPP